MPFAREYGGLLDNRSFGGAQVSRTFYARGQTGQQLLLGAYGALNRMIDRGQGRDVHEARDARSRRRRRDVARGIITRHLDTGEYERHSAHAVLLCTGGYGNAFYLSTNAKNSQRHRAWRAHKRGAFFANPCYTQIHPTCIPRSQGDYQSKLTLMSESLRNDGRVWVPLKNAGDTRPRGTSSEANATTTSSASTRASATWCRATSRHATRRRCATTGRASARPVEAVYLDFADAIARRWAEEDDRGALRQPLSRCTSASPARTRTRSPMRIYPAVHYTMGGLWVDYNLESTMPGLFVLGEANFSDHGANRLGASALMQGLADGYFVIPATVARATSRGTAQRWRAT